MILDVCKTSLTKIVSFTSVTDNFSSAESDSEINFFNFLNSCFFVNFESTVIFMKTVNLTLIEIKALMISNHLSFSFIYVICSLSLLNFKNFISECSLLIFIKRCHYISCFFILAHCFSYRRLLQSVSLFFII